MRLAGATGLFLLNSVQSKRALLLFDEVYTSAIASFDVITPDALAAVAEEYDPAEIRSLAFGEGRRLRSLLERAGAVKVLREPDDDCFGGTWSARGGTLARRVACEATDVCGFPVAAFVRNDHVVGIDAGVASTLRLVIEALPLPGVDTPFEAVLDWRSDPESRARHVRLRAWLAKLSRNQTDLDFDEIATMIDDYDTYMRKHHQTMERTRVEVVVVTLARVIEDAMQFKLSTAIEKLFHVFTKETTVFAAELAAPGREVAYIATARQRFN